MKKIFLLTILFLVLNIILYGQNIYTVTKVSDPDPFDHPYSYNDALCDTAMYGTLQWAIRKTNDATPPSEIRFNIPGTGQHIINLNFSFPAINKQVNIDGSSQPGYNYNNGPSIIIDGANIPYNSACFNINANSSVIKGLLIKNFYLSYGIIILGPSDVKIKDNIFQNVGGWNPSLAYYRAMSVYIAAPNCVIQGNIFGTDITGTVNYGSTAEAIYLQNQWQPADNCLIGGSGANEPNIVANSGWGGGWAGVSILNGKYNKISRNKIYNNPLGISLLIYAGPGWWGNEGRPSPVIDSLIPSGILYGTSQPNDIIELFGSSGPQNANEYLQYVVADASGNWNATMVDFNSPYFIATATDASNNTSELSGVYEIIIPPPMATCATATEITIDTVCIPQNYLAQTTDLWFKFTTDTANIDIRVSYPATAAASIDKISAYEGLCDSLVLYSQINNDTLSLYDLTPGNTYYLKLHAALTGNFNICTQKAEPIFIPPDYAAEQPASNGAYYENRGQIIDTYNNLRPDIKYYSKSSYPEIYLSDTAISFVLTHVDTIPSTIDTLCRVDMKLGGNSHLSRPYKREQATGYLNYYLGHCPQGVTNVNGYYRVVYPDAYPGINLQCYSNSMGTKFYFVLKPGAKTDNIILKFNGADAVSIDGNGKLIIQTTLGNIEFEHAQCYKVNPAGNVVPMPNQGDYVQISPTEIGFNLQQPPGNTMPVVIMMEKGISVTSPTAIDNLIHSTYSSGNNYDEYRDIITDNSGNIYITGYTNSTNFPVTTGVIQTSIGSSGYVDAIVQKIDQNMILQWSTYYGGNYEDKAYSIAVDQYNNVFFAGQTTSTNFPTYFPSGTYPDNSNTCGIAPCYDMFIVKLNPSGNAKLWATYYGGTDPKEIIYDICLDAVGNLYCVGQKDANTDLFTQTGASNYTSGGGIILKFDNTGARLWVTAIGGSGGWAQSVAIDKDNNLIVTGQTNSGLQTLNAYQNSLNGTWDAYLVKFDNTNTNVWCTYFGGDGDELCYGVITDSDDNIFITGKTNTPTNSNFPIIDLGSPSYFEGSYQGEGSSFSYIGDAFIAKFNSTGTPITSTYYGGSADENGLNIAIDSYNRIYVTGPTTSADFDLLPSNPSGTFSQTSLSNTNDTKEDAFLISFSPLLQRLWTTYFGGGSGSGGTFTSDRDISYGITTYNNSRLYIVGGTSSSTYFPLVDISNGSGGVYYYNSLSGSVDGFLSVFDLTPVPLSVEDINNDKLDVLIYPNPTNGKIFLNLNLLTSSSVQISIYNNMGSLIYNNSYKQLYGYQQISINLSVFSKGLYFVKATIGDNIISKKIIFY